MKTLERTAPLGQWMQRVSGRNLSIMEPKQVRYGFLCFKVESELGCFHSRLQELKVLLTNLLRLSENLNLHQHL